MSIESSKSQSWSIDISLGVVIFMAAFFIFYAILNTNQNTKFSDLRQEAATVVKLITSEGETIILNNNEVNLTKAGALKNLDYDELRRRLRIEGDFCIYIEDGNGNIVLINNTYKGIGAPNIMIGGTPCSQK